MNEGMRSTTMIVIIIVFISVVSAYMAYNVNYTKAFRMKNKIIALYEEYDGDCGADCKEEIAEYAKDIGYTSINNLHCEESYFKPDDPSVRTQTFDRYGYCEYKVNVVKSSSASVFEDNNSNPGYYYRILTRIDINIPIIQNVLDLRILNITGDTKTFND